MSNAVQLVKDGVDIFPLTDISLVIGLEDRLNAIDGQSYVMAWDGTAAPVVANIPAGVSVTYNATTYTGTLAASANTINKIYLVYNGTGYNRYVTSVNGNTYSWMNIGSTDIDLNDYAHRDSSAVAGNLAKFDSNGDPVDSRIAADNVNLRPVYEFNTNSYLNQLIKELYLIGLDPTKKYYFYFLNYYSTTGYTANQIYIYQCDDDQHTNPIYVAGGEDTTLSNGIFKLIERNSSGISGYILVDIPIELTSSIFNYRYRLNNFINIEFASNIDYSPSINTYLNSIDFSNKINDLIEVEGSYTSVTGTAFKQKYFEVDVGDIIIVTTDKVSNYGVILRISQNNGSSWVNSYDPIYSPVTNKEYTITHKGSLFVTISSSNSTNVTVSIKLKNLRYDLDQGAAGISYNNTSSQLTAQNVQSAIDEISNSINCIGKVVYHRENVTWGPGSAGQIVFVIPDNTKRYKVRVLGNNTYLVSRYTSDWVPNNYNIYNDENWHEIPILSNTYRLVLQAVSVEQTATLIEIATIGVEVYDTKFTLPIHRYTVQKTSSTADYNSLLECILEAVKYPNSEVIVNEGTYDLISEFESYYGSDFFTNFNQSSIPGIRLFNNIRIIFSTNALVTFNYEGSNQYVNTIFSPFNANYNSYGGFTLENLHIEAKNCRYCIHDEKDSTTDSYCHKYINCDMYMDNSGNQNWSSKQCIGGGLGKSGYIEVIGCSFETVTDSLTETAFSWHNCGSDSNAQSSLNIRNNYVKKGTFTLLWLGTTTKITKAFVSGNSFTSEIKHLSGGGSVENTELIAWNNEIRNV